MALVHLSVKVGKDMQLGLVVATHQAAHSWFMQETLGITGRIFHFPGVRSQACGVVLTPVVLAAVGGRV